MEIEQYSNFLKQFFDDKFVEDLINSLDRTNIHSFRLNKNKLPPKEFYENLERHPIVPNGYIYNKDVLEAGKHPFHAAGCYYIQEPSAMLVGHFLEAENGDKICDLCASPGGKSTQVSNEIGDEGFLLSNDINNQRSLNLSENIERMGITNTIVINESIEKIVNKFEGYFDKVILDAPCSGEGMFRKSDAVKNDWSIEKVQKLSEIQKTLIMQAYKLLKKDGILIYSTCTYNKYEDEDTINYLLSNTKASLINIEKTNGLEPGIDIKEAVRAFPNKFNGEGHFICKIKCNDDNNEAFIKQFKSNISNKQLQIFKEFVKENLNIKFDESRLLVSNDNLYYTPSVKIDLGNIHTIRNGLYLGEFKNNLFFPSHHLATSSKPNDWKRVVDLDSESTEIKKYLKGETINVNCDNGFALVTVNNCSIGFGKVVNGVLKNHYPKGLRV